ncbi:(2Fe-2S)-binding protein [Novosphingobium umbonatum]|uniref:(2Fe-2S)-binding protein n=1 Tax=Novosphingobium umbonatum TaxID=1908524 RepID=A0A3S2UUX1_9SPHN|nr:(2Fe-2S)-binding protein [Novosphingobium umbonatum]RVU07666.1 (2Fe-2S)-binding protein [Novosphingobium umbonatum]
MPIALTVNRKKVSVTTDSDKPLLWVLREDLHMAGTKFGCGQGLCGACTVLMDGQAVRSCQTPISAAAGKAITTIEGAKALPQGAALVEAWQAIDVPQCGYCQAGQILSATALLQANPKPSDAEIDEGMNGNICRCATYIRIRRAIRMAAGLPDVTGDAA